MRRLLVIALFLNASLVAGRLFQKNADAQEGTTPATDERFCTDPNGDGVLNIADATAILGYLFSDGEAPYCVAQELTLCEAADRFCEFHPRVAGSFFGRFEYGVDGRPGCTPSTLMLNIHADGTFTLGGILGAWKQNGDDGLIATGSQLVVDADGETVIQIVDSEFILQPGDDELTWTFTFKNYALTSNPLDPNTLPVSRGSGSGQANRLVPRSPGQVFCSRFVR